jgi:cellulose synthase/poly-beta-1,6-N-acetylglucosamine synthase-like glycosyltransferase
MLQAIFYLSAGLLLYEYLLYPVLLAALSSIWRTHADRFDAGAPRKWPSMSVIVAAYNEAAVIAEKITNFKACAYPGVAKMIVISDGSEDRTAEIAESCASDRVLVLRQPSRSGKGSALNAAVGHADGEILVFTDANTMFRPDALTQLGLGFGDPSIGLVTGVSRYPDGTIGSAYQRYEQMLKGYESRLGVVATADGAIYAMRKALYQEKDPRFINDFMHPILVSLQGCDAVMSREAICVEDYAADNEFARQVRMVSQAAAVLFTFLPDLIRGRRWLSIFVLTSHKMLRWTTAPLLVAALLSTCMLASLGGIYRIALIAEMLFATTALGGMIARSYGMEGAVTFAYQFVALNCAQAFGLWRSIVSDVPVVWKPRNL